MKTITGGRAGGPRKFFQVLLCGAAALLWAVAGAANPTVGNHPNRTRTTGRLDAASSSDASVLAGDGNQDLARGHGGPFNLPIFLRQRPTAFSIVNVTHQEAKLGATTFYTFASTQNSATTAAAIPAQTLNLSTRMRTDTGNNVGIGGFTIAGAVPKHVIIGAIGSSLTKFGFAAARQFT